MGTNNNNYNENIIALYKELNSEIPNNPDPICWYNSTKNISNWEQLKCMMLGETKADVHKNSSDSKIRAQAIKGEELFKKYNCK
ncbi:MAG: hypothetical protein LBQ24_04890 [Candidatus Peribacteria bacterium]|jgi:hypothetical protein|nr:hypothetical protein [Candidatus Peribacteria bacterium]